MKANIHPKYVEAVVKCAAQQEQVASDTRQRLLAIEFAPNEGNLTGTLALPPA